MYKIIYFFVLCLAFTGRGLAQILPADGSILNYRIIGFSFPAPPAKGYTLEIASGNNATVEAFKRNIIAREKSKKGKIIVTVPYFGAEYTWRVISDKAGAGEKNTVLHHFSTGKVPAVDTDTYRLRIINKAKRYKDAFVFVDATGILYDMNGRPVWYLPEIKEHPGSAPVRDLKESPFGTITFIKGSRIFEVGYDGKVLWQKPDGRDGDKKLDTINNLYHHEFTRLANGHYMAMGSETLLCKLPEKKDSSFVIIRGTVVQGSTSIAPMQFGTIVEFDESGKVVWSWKTADYVMASDLRYNGAHNSLTDLHDNSFFFDEAHKAVYISFKGVSRIIKVKYPEGTVLGTYGIIYTSHDNLKTQLDIQENRYPFFCGQHSCRFSGSGKLYLFNNGCDLNAASRITVLEEPEGPKDTLKKVWEYVCSTGDLGQQLGIQPNSGGGNVTGLPGAMFAAMGYQCNKVFIVDKNRRMLWSAVSEKKDTSTNEWRAIPSYRSSLVIDRKALERMIWQSQR